MKTRILCLKQVADLLLANILRRHRSVILVDL